MDFYFKSRSESYAFRIGFSFKKFRCLKKNVYIYARQKKYLTCFLLRQISEVCDEQWHIIFSWILHTHNPETLIFATLSKYIEAYWELQNFQMFLRQYTKGCGSKKRYYPHVNVKIPQEKCENNETDLHLVQPKRKKNAVD